MTMNNKLKKRYKLSLIGIVLAIFSVLLLRACDIDFERKQMMTTKELKAILALNSDLYVNKSIDEDVVKTIRDNVANRISYKQLFDEKSDFKNFKNDKDKNIYGFQLENKVHVGFYKNGDTCVNYNENADYCIGIIIDVNGYTRPNKLGKDQYILKIYSDTIK